MPAKLTLKQQLKELNQEIQGLKIAVQNPSDHGKKEQAGLAANLVIPNKLYLLWDRKISLQKKLGKVFLNTAKWRIYG